MKDFRIAAVTCQAPLGRVDENLERTIRWTRRACAENADLVCFPELNITGYCNSPQLADIALAVPGPVTDKLIRLSIDENIIILAGMAEKNHQGPPFASHVVITPDGGMGVYRKLHLAVPEKATFTAGDRIPVFPTGPACLGIQLCFDAHFPELSGIMRSNGAEVLIFPHASPNGTAEEKNSSWQRHLTARAFDNSVYVVACNQIGENCSGLQFPGNAMAIDPSGRIIAQNIRNQASMLKVDLKAGEIDAVRNHPMRHFFPHRRPELYPNIA